MGSQSVGAGSPKSMWEVSRAGQRIGREEVEGDEATWERKSSHKVLVALAKLRPVPFRRERLRDGESDPRKVEGRSAASC